VTYRLGPLTRTISGMNLASGVFLLLMGIAMVWIGAARNAMPSSKGWQAELSATLQHWGHELTRALSWIPGWTAAVVLAVAALLLARAGIRQAIASDDHDEVDESERALPLDDRKLEREHEYV
jgi:hypothetical protein